MINNKGFTLLELLVAVVILGIITGISFPTLKAIREANDKKKYTSYGDYLINNAKLYMSSYEYDLFSKDPTVSCCNYITADMFNNRKLFKDIQVKGMICKTDSTFVVINRQNGAYSYNSYVGCRNDSGSWYYVSSDSSATTTPYVPSNICTNICS